MYVGEDVKVAAEIMEVGKDVVKRIEQRRKEMEALNMFPTFAFENVIVRGLSF